jgi:hypothetical protein
MLLLTQWDEFRLLYASDRDAALEICGDDEGSARGYRSERRPIGPKLRARIREKLGLPEMTWGEPFDDLLDRIRPVMALPLNLREEPIRLLRESPLGKATLYHAGGVDCDDPSLLRPRAGQNLASALMLYCWAPYAGGAERDNAPKLAAQRCSIAIDLIERERELRNSGSDHAETELSMMAAYAHTNHVAMYSEFRAGRFAENGGFETFTDADVEAALACAGDKFYELFKIVKPGSPVKRTVSQNLLSAASRSRQLARAGEAWAALVKEWVPARNLANEDSGIDRRLADDPAFAWLIHDVLGGNTEYDEKKFPEQKNIRNHIKKKGA